MIVLLVRKVFVVSILHDGDVFLHYSTLEIKNFAARSHGMSHTKSVSTFGLGYTFSDLQFLFYQITRVRAGTFSEFR